MQETGLTSRRRGNVPEPPTNAGVLWLHQSSHQNLFSFLAALDFLWAPRTESVEICAHTHCSIRTEQFCCTASFCCRHTAFLVTRFFVTVKRICCPQQRVIHARKDIRILDGLLRRKKERVNQGCACLLPFKRPSF